MFSPPNGTYWRISKETFDELNSDNRIWWGARGTATPRVKKFLSEAKQGVVPATLWLHQDAGTNAEAKVEVRNLLSSDGAEVFMTPKPERLIKQVLSIASDPGDLILDSFLGSATTAATAHKMGRRYIGIEMGDHAKTHCVPRLKRSLKESKAGLASRSTGKAEAASGFALWDKPPSTQMAGSIQRFGSTPWLRSSGTLRPLPQLLKPSTSHC